MFYIFFLQEKPHLWRPSELMLIEGRAEILINAGTRNSQESTAQLWLDSGNCNRALIKKDPQDIPSSYPHIMQLQNA